MDGQLPELDFFASLNGWQMQLICAIIFGAHAVHAARYQKWGWWFGLEYFVTMTVLILTHIFAVALGIKVVPTAGALGMVAAASIVCLPLAVVYQLVVMMHMRNAGKLDDTLKGNLIWWMTSRITLLGCLQLLLGYAAKSLQHHPVGQTTGLMSAVGFITLVLVLIIALWQVRRQV